MKHSVAHLIDKVLAVIVTEFLGPYDAVHVGLHELLHEIDLSEVFQRVRFEDVEYAYDILVSEMA